MVVFCLVLSLAVLAAGEHSGAYSSPQYAKKMYPKAYDANAILPREKPPIPFDNSASRFDVNDTAQYGRSSFMDTAGSFLNSAGGQLVSGLAKDFIARSTGSSQVGFDCVSQVLSLNLTNLVILIVLKALILAAGFFGAGAWKGGHHYARSLDDNKNASYLTEDEVLLYLSYLSGQQKKDFGCLYRLSCQKPDQAALYSSGAELLLQGAKLLQGCQYQKKSFDCLYRLSCKKPDQAALYSSGAELLLQGAKLLQGNSIELEPYEDVSKGIKKAVEWGETGGPCESRYPCGQ